LALHPNWAALEQRQFVAEGVNIRYVGQMHVRKTDNIKTYHNSLLLIWYAALATWRLFWIALRTPTDTIHLGKPHPMNGLAGYIVSRLRHKALYVDCDDYEASINQFQNKWQRQIVTWFENHVPLQAQAVTTNTKFTQNRLIALGYPAHKIVYVPNGVDFERFAKVDYNKIETLRQKLDLHRKQVILFVGTLSIASHNVDLLIKAFAKIAPQVEEAILLLVGGGQDWTELTNLVHELKLSERVIFAGRVIPDEVVNYYHLAYISVDPILDNETAQARSPLKIFESLGAGVPVVTSNVGDRYTMLQGSRYGFLTQPGEVDSLAEGLLEALLNPPRVDQMKVTIKNEQKFMKLYWNLLAADFAQVYCLPSDGTDICSQATI
jgi:glycosyltransferase involved in cell wall biosynthesis